MIETFYPSIQVFVWILLLITGIYLLTGNVPTKKVFKVYSQSRKAIGIAFLIYCLQFFLQWKFNVRDTFPLAASALNISLFYVSGILLGGSFIYLLDQKFVNRRRFFLNLSIWFISFIIVWLAVFCFSGFWAKLILNIAAIWLFIYMIYLSWTFYLVYKQAIIKIHNYYSENIAVFIRWMSKSVFFAIIMGVLCPILAFAPKWVITIYLALSVPFFFYVFICVIDYMLYFEEIDDAVSDDSKDVINLYSKVALNENIDSQIVSWVALKGYHSQKINMGELAKQMGTNRSYLSCYINSNYSCSFYEWISGLRIEDAKIILKEHPEFSMVQIAEKVGFSSASHFTRLFTDREKKSPTHWRDEYLMKVTKNKNE